MTLEEQLRQVLAAKPTVDFDYFHLRANNRDYAQRICVLLMDFARQDDLQYTDKFENKDWPVQVGSGGSGAEGYCMTQSHQRAIVASAFANYANHSYNSLWLGLAEFQILKELLTEIEDDMPDFYPGPRGEYLKKRIDMLEEVIAEFKRCYLREDPGFMFKLIAE